MSSSPALDALEAALKAERQALNGQDVEALLRSTEAKMQALRVAEASVMPADASERVSALAAYNRENGLLLARRRRAVAFALRQLGRTESVGYDTRGNRAHNAYSRSIAVA
jgi:hypothetical protein